MDILPAEPVATNRKWYELWLEVWKRPSDTSFKSILNERDHSALRGLIWIAVVAVIAALVSNISGVPYISAFVPQMTGITIFKVIGDLIIAPIIAIILNMLLTGVLHLIAKIFHGNGQWSDLVFCLTAISAPAYILVAIASLIIFAFGSIQNSFLIVSICYLVFSLILTIYSIVLYINAIKAVENISTGQAVATYFIPTIILLLIAACIFFTVLITSSVRT
jgi:hypothetical protein